jgi:N-ethylmaleimide reductase
MKRDYTIFTDYKLGNTELKNRIVMSPMTRSRAIENIPNKLMAEYYGQRAGAGLMITEGTSPSPDGLGYSRIPGVFSDSQVEGWKLITREVHKNGSTIFIQLMHTGRISHPLNLPHGARILSPSAVRPAGKMWTDQEQLQEFPVPEEMSAEDIIHTQNEYSKAAVKSIEAGFDGVELHGANGYLPEQFISPASNRRTDKYGGSIENRCRFVLEVVKRVVDSIGKERTGIRLSPYGVAGDMPLYPDIDAAYKYLAFELDLLEIAYIHIVDHSSMGSPAVPSDIKTSFRKIFKNTIILSGGYDMKRAEADLNSGLGNLVAFGRPFINNPDLVERFRNQWPLAGRPDSNLFYTPGAKGYTDYPLYKAEPTPCSSDN